MVKKPTSTDGWIGVDLDGTLFEYHGWTKWNHFGPPIEPMVKRVIDWIAAGQEVRIVTARISFREYIRHTCRHTGEKFTNADMRRAIADHCEKYVGSRLWSQCYKDLSMIELWDDRAVGVVANTGQTLVDAALAEKVARSGRAFGDNQE
jgi:RNase P/RNase MRP subunit POP5